MAFSTITTIALLIATPLVAGAATPPPGFHQVGSDCTKAQRFTRGWSLDGADTIVCDPNLTELHGLSGQSWFSLGSCAEPQEQVSSFCFCDSNGGNCGCSPEVITN